MTAAGQPTAVAAAAGPAPARPHRELSIVEAFRSRLSGSVGPIDPADLHPRDARSDAALEAAWRRTGRRAGLETFAATVFSALRGAYDDKYGRWDEVNDLRDLYPTTWSAPIRDRLPRVGVRSALGVGVNDAREVRMLVPDPRVELHLVDVSTRALSAAGTHLHDYDAVRCTNSTFESWDGPAGAFDLFFALRTVNSTSVDVGEFVRKSRRMVRPGGTLVYSVPNGYVCDEAPGGEVHGMYDPDSGRFDEQRPTALADQVRRILVASGCERPEVVAGPAEIFVLAQASSEEGTAP